MHDQHAAHHHDPRVDMGGPTALVWIERPDGGKSPAYVYVREDGTLYVKPRIEETDRG